MPTTGEVVSDWHENDVSDFRDAALLDEDDGPSVQELQSAEESGLACAECGTRFVKAHNATTVCLHCGRRLLEGMGYKLATHAEANSAAHTERARERKRNRRDT